jgi:RNA polymerase sigma factor (sigma-70 family)
MAELTNEELCALAASGDEESFEILLKRNENFVREYAWKAWRRIADSEVDRSLTYDDLYQTAVIAFWEAAKKYDPERDAQFISFAGTVIGSRLTDELKRAYADYAAAGAFVRFDKELDGENGPAFRETHLHHFQQMPDVIYLKKEQRRVVRDAINSLTPRQRLFILHRFGFLDGEPMTMAEACRVFSLSETRAKDTEAKAFETIRAEYEKNYKAKIEGLLFWQRFLREDEGFYIPFVPPSVCANLPFTPAFDDKTPDE